MLTTNKKPKLQINNEHDFRDETKLIESVKAFVSKTKLENSTGWRWESVKAFPQKGGASIIQFLSVSKTKLENSTGWRWGKYHTIPLRFQNQIRKLNTGWSTDVFNHVAAKRESV